MKRNRLIAFLAIAITVIATSGILSCDKQKQFESPNSETMTGARNSALSVTCPPAVLSGTISTPITLVAGASYLLRGNVVISNTTLTIQPGVVIFGEKATNGALVVLPNASINAAGTSTNPIIFTSDQNPGSRAAADWAGVFLLGSAPNNQSNSLAIQLNGSSFTAGGSTANSSVGTFKYVQIHFAGAGGGSGSDRKSESSLVLASAGSASVIDHIQISNSGLDGMGVWGGTVNLKNIFNVNVKRTDFIMSYGYIGRDQYLGAIKRETVVAASPEAYGIEIPNVLLNEPTSATPRTYPTLSNVTLMGGNYCGTGSALIRDGIFFSKNGSARIYNTVVSSFARYGLNLNNDVIANTATGAFELQFSYNSFHNITSGDDFRPITNLDWTTNSGCIPTMSAWIGGTGLGCQEDGNQFSADISTLGYNSSFCGNYCGTGFTPNFILGTTDLDNADFGWDSGSQFEHPTYRGAYGTTSWVTNTWTDFCPLNTNYCV